MAYATVDQLEQGWRTLSADEKTRASTLLDRASIMLDSLVTIDSTSTTQADILMVVCCNMVQRVMESPSMGIESESMGAGGYSQSWNYANPSGDMYLTKSEKKMLGIETSWAGGQVKVAIHDCAGDEIDW